MRTDDYKQTYATWEIAAQVGGRVYRVGPGQYRVTTPTPRPYHRAKEKQILRKILQRMGYS